MGMSIHGEEIYEEWIYKPVLFQSSLKAGINRRLSGEHTYKKKSRWITHRGWLSALKGLAVGFSLLCEAVETRQHRSLAAECDADRSVPVQVCRDAVRLWCGSWIQWILDPMDLAQERTAQPQDAHRAHQLGRSFGISPPCFRPLSVEDPSAKEDIRGKGECVDFYTLNYYFKAAEKTPRGSKDIETFILVSLRNLYLLRVIYVRNLEEEKKEDEQVSSTEDHLRKTLCTCLQGCGSCEGWRCLKAHSAASYRQGEKLRINARLIGGIRRLFMIRLRSEDFRWLWQFFPAGVHGHRVLSGTKIALSQGLTSLIRKRELWQITDALQSAHVACRLPDGS